MDALTEELSNKNKHLHNFFFPNEIPGKMTVSPFPQSDDSSKNNYDDPALNSEAKLVEFLDWETWIGRDARLGELNW